MMYMYCFNLFGEQPAAQRYVVHMDYMNTPFQLDSSSGELSVNQSLQMEGTQSKYDIVVVSDGGSNIETWTVTTITIGEIEIVLHILQVVKYRVYIYTSLN